MFKHFTGYCSYSTDQNNHFKQVKGFTQTCDSSAVTKFGVELLGIFKKAINSLRKRELVTLFILALICLQFCQCSSPSSLGAVGWSVNRGCCISCLMNDDCLWLDPPWLK